MPRHREQESAVFQRFNVVRNTSIRGSGFVGRDEETSREENPAPAADCAFPAGANAPSGNQYEYDPKHLRVTGSSTGIPIL